MWPFKSSAQKYEMVLQALRDSGEATSIDVWSSTDGLSHTDVVVRLLRLEETGLVTSRLPPGEFRSHRLYKLAVRP